MTKEIGSRMVASQGTGKIHYKSFLVEKVPIIGLRMPETNLSKIYSTIKNKVKRKKKTKHYEVGMKAKATNNKFESSMISDTEIINYKT